MSTEQTTLSLLAAPPEILTVIARLLLYTNPASLFALARTCHTLRAFFADTDLWHLLFLDLSQRYVEVDSELIYFPPPPADMTECEYLRLCFEDICDRCGMQKWDEDRTILLRFRCVLCKHCRSEVMMSALEVDQFVGWRYVPGDNCVWSSEIETRLRRAGISRVPSEISDNVKWFKKSDVEYAKKTWKNLLNDPVVRHFVGKKLFGGHGEEDTREKRAAEKRFAFLAQFTWERRRDEVLRRVTEYNRAFERSREIIQHCPSFIHYCRAEPELLDFQFPFVIKSLPGEIIHTARRRRRIEERFDIPPGSEKLNILYYCGFCKNRNRKGRLKTFSKVRLLKQHAMEMHWNYNDQESGYLRTVWNVWGELDYV